MSRFTSLSLVVGSLAFALALSGCAKQPGVEAPAWPEQPSPSYPDATAESEPEKESPSQLDEPHKEAPVAAPAASLAKRYDGKKPLETLDGKASYYADSLAGNHTANGDVYDPKEFTAAHKKLPFGTIARVIREDTGAVTYVRINDRGPFGDQARIIDLSKAAAQQLDMMKAGVVNVTVEIVEKPEK